MLEIRLPYELRMLAFPPRVASEDFLTVNPRGTVPLVHRRHRADDRVCRHLRVSGATVRADDASASALARATLTTTDYLNYLHMSDTTLTFPQTLVLRYSRFEQPPDRLATTRSRRTMAKWFHARLRTLEAHVANHEFLCAGRFTAADVAGWLCVDAGWSCSDLTTASPRPSPRLLAAPGVVGSVSRRW